MVSFGNLPNGFEASLGSFGSAKVAGCQGFCKRAVEITRNAIRIASYSYVTSKRLSYQLVHADVALLRENGSLAVQFGIDAHIEGTRVGLIGLLAYFRTRFQVAFHRFLKRRFHFLGRFTFIAHKVHDGFNLPVEDFRFRAILHDAEVAFVGKYVVHWVGAVDARLAGISMTERNPQPCKGFTAGWQIFSFSIIKSNW